MQLHTAVLSTALTLFPGLVNAQETSTEILQPNVETEAGPAVPSLLNQVFKDILEPDQVAALASDAAPESFVGIMLPGQKDAARSKLRELEKTEPKPAELNEIERGYRLLGATADLFRVGMRRQGLVATDSREITIAAQTAYDKDRKDDALRLAAEALARNPEDKQAFAILMLAKAKVQPKKLNLPDPFGDKDLGGDGSAHGGGTDQVVSGDREPTPQALGIMRRAVEARRAGDLDKTQSLALDAMRADPAAPSVQKLYTAVIEDRAKQMRRFRQAFGFLEQAVDAENAGHRERAISLAQQAAASDPNPMLKKFVVDLRAKPAVAKKEEPPKTPANDGSRAPWWPLTAGAGLGALGYSISRSGRGWSPQENTPPDDEDLNSERIQKNRYHLKVAAISFAIGFGIVYIGPWAVSAAGSAAMRMWRGGAASLQKVAASEVGAINPSGVQVAQRTEIWSRGKFDDATVNAFDHWKRHGHQFPELSNSKEYVEAAWKFLRNPPPGTLTRTKVSIPGETVFYNPTTNVFVVRAANGVPKTMYKPEVGRHPFPTNLDYFNAQ